MIDSLKLLACFVVSLFRSKGRLEAEIVILRHQLNVLRRRMPSRARLTLIGRLIFVWLYRLRPSVLGAAVIVHPETVVRWHREGFRLYWRWKSRARGGRPRLPRDLRDLIREMSLANPLWGAPRIHGELLKLGIEIAQSTVAKYMAQHRRPPSQSWKTFLRNHAAGIAAMDLLVVPTIDFCLFYVLVILGQNGYVERLIGSIRRECLDHLVVFGEAHLRRTVTAYVSYYNELRTHLSLTKDTPIHRPIQRIGRIMSVPVLGGLHHQYCRT
jgi:hypothetical protein